MGTSIEKFENICQWIVDLELVRRVKGVEMDKIVARIICTGFTNDLQSC